MLYKGNTREDSTTNLFPKKRLQISLAIIVANSILSAKLEARRLIFSVKAGLYPSVYRARTCGPYSVVAFHHEERSSCHIPVPYIRSACYRGNKTTPYIS